MTYPRRVVIDTNVLIVANDKADHASNECVLAAVDFLSAVRRNLVVVLDQGGHIFAEYQKYCSFKGQPGLGDRFFLELHRARGNRARVSSVEISIKENESYEEVPDGLSKFDPSDHKFIATVVADGLQSTIVNCVDSDWREAAEALNSSGIRVLELCPTC
jgi:predicted nucleic acid-binding protein